MTETRVTRSCLKSDLRSVLVHPGYIGRVKCARAKSRKSDKKTENFQGIGMKILFCSAGPTRPPATPLSFPLPYMEEASGIHAKYLSITN